MDIVVALYRAAIATFALVGVKEIWLQGDVDGLVYLTNQAGFMLAFVMIWGTLAALRVVPQPPGWLKGAITLFLVIVGLVSHFVLAPEDPSAPVSFLGLTQGQIEHQITPIAAAADFLLCDGHRRLRWRHAALWLSYLVGYAVFALIRAELLAEPHYPYPFIDLGELGWGGMLLNIAIYAAGFYLLGMLLVLIDRLLPERALLGSAVGGWEPPVGEAVSTAGKPAAVP